MAAMPRQKPGKSVQDVGTPPEVLRSVRSFLGIDNFCIDLAASGDNNVATPVGGRYIGRHDNSLVVSWADNIDVSSWAWLNPPFADISPWVGKAANEKAYLPNYAGIAVLVPASVGANWWKQWVHGHALALFLNGRITFVGHTKPYPKDTALLLYSNSYSPGYDVWSWKEQE